ncbi:MAG TPA: protein-L-isoaspartate(D-aspartate) O-methyltransferase [Sphingobium sp.]|nr:protein-L-isoaspartate(D-aspartate) O-methyltransferase [Sphingobium sp.]
MADMERLRRMMVDQQIARRGVGDARLLAAMRDVPRDQFVPEELRAHAHDDMPLPLGAGQTISQPYIVAVMIEAAAIKPDDRVLEVGLGSGYAAAIMSRLAAQVFAIERIAELADEAAARMAALGYDNVTIGAGDGTEGWPEQAPFDVISVAAGGSAVPQPLRDQLAVGGRLIMPIGTAAEQRLVRLVREDAETFVEQRLEAVRFVPLIGAHGWQG